MLVSATLDRKIVGAETSAAAFEAGVMSVQSVSGRPAIATELDTVEMRERRMFHHWNQLPMSPFGISPIFRISSASHIDACISSSVPASRPRMESLAR